MQHRDRLAAVALIVLALASWIAVAVLITTRSPTGDAMVQLTGAVLIGLACGLTTVPLAWLAAFGRHRRIAYLGDWRRAARRGAWVGLVMALLVALRTQHALSIPIALFVIVMVVFVEVSLSVDR